MSLLYPGILALYLFALIPIYGYYKKDSDMKYKRKILLLSFVLFLILLAFARPVLSQRVADVQSQGTEIVAAIDLSASMKATDLKPSRADKARELLHDLVASSGQDKFAILGFTTSAIILSTMTDDKTLLFELFQRLNRDHVVSKSTDMHSVFELANQLSLLDKKQLIIFSDGAEGDLQKEIAYAKEHDIRVYCVGMATRSGTSLYDEKGEVLLNEKGDIVISALNENLKELSLQTGGAYFDYDDSMSDIIEAIHKDALMQLSHSKELSYIELFYIPLVAAVILFILASTSMLSRYIAVALLFFPLEEAKASVLDFYTISKAKENFVFADYNKSALYFSALEDKNWQSLFNAGTAYYKASNYAKARACFSRIKTRDAHLKATLFYNIGNTYAKEYYYKKAAHAYRQSLALHESQESLENLLKVAFLEDRKEMFTGRKEASKKDDAQEESMSDSSNQSRSKSSGQQASSSNSGRGVSQSKKSEQKLTSQKKAKIGLSSKQYETINKGNYNEKNPW